MTAVHCRGHRGEQAGRSSRLRGGGPRGPQPGVSALASSEGTEHCTATVFLWPPTKYTLSRAFFILLFF